MPFRAQHLFHAVIRNVLSRVVTNVGRNRVLPLGIASIAVAIASSLALPSPHCDAQRGRVTLMIYEVGDIVRKQTHFPAPRLGLPDGSDSELESSGILVFDDEDNLDATYSIDTLIELIKETVAPGTWDGNPNSIEHYGSRLFVMTHDDLRGDVGDTLARARRKKPSVVVAVSARWVELSNDALATLPKSTTPTSSRRYRTIAAGDVAAWLDASSPDTRDMTTWVSLDDFTNAHLALENTADEFDERHAAGVDAAGVDAADADADNADTADSADLDRRAPDNVELQLETRGTSRGNPKVSWKLVQRVDAAAAAAADATPATRTKTRTLARGRAQLRPGEVVVVTECKLPVAEGRTAVLILEHRPPPVRSAEKPVVAEANRG